MATASEKGKVAVARLYSKKPDASLDEFIAAARKADPGIKEPKDRRSFNASYVLPLKRSAAAKERPERAAKKTAKKRGPGRPRKKKVATKRGPGRPRKKVTKKVATKRGPGRPRKKVTKKVAAKRGPGRPRKKVTKKVATKRGPGRPSKKVTKRGPGRPRKTATTATRGPGRPRKRPGITANNFAAIRQMIVSREQELMAAAGDHSKAYQLATEIDGFIEKLVKKMTR